VGGHHCSVAWFTIHTLQSDWPRLKRVVLSGFRHRTPAPRCQWMNRDRRTNTGRVPVRRRSRMALPRSDTDRTAHPLCAAMCVAFLRGCGSQARSACTRPAASRPSWGRASVLVQAPDTPSSVSVGESSKQRQCSLSHATHDPVKGARGCGSTGGSTRRIVVSSPQLRQMTACQTLSRPHFRHGAFGCRCILVKSGAVTAAPHVR
jgi:hypothetical protein